MPSQKPVLGRTSRLGISGSIVENCVALVGDAASLDEPLIEARQMPVVLET